jgi:hypothetical protein
MIINEHTHTAGDRYNNSCIDSHDRDTCVSPIFIVHVKCISQTQSVPHHGPSIIDRYRCYGHCATVSSFINLHEGSKDCEFTSLVLTSFQFHMDPRGHKEYRALRNIQRLLVAVPSYTPSTVYYNRDGGSI